jgi:hypothetical protein
MSFIRLTHQHLVNKCFAIDLFPSDTQKPQGLRSPQSRPQAVSGNAFWRDLGEGLQPRHGVQQGSVGLGLTSGDNPASCICYVMR